MDGVDEDQVDRVASHRIGDHKERLFRGGGREGSINSPSRSYGDGRMEMEVYESRPQPSLSGPHDLRWYSASYASSHSSNQAPKEVKLKKGKSASGSSSSRSGWSLSDPELQRKKRVAGYKAYAVEGKMKGSLRKSFRWLKDRCTQVAYGWW
ncbi:hypothetical protein B296_00003337 [Ensete ventricosum]|uniref:DUF3511 domain-containing protein n=1 Tax=Ensete ventricosum TaxID=4639 RepID=A0A427BA81_ENSVE|nr:hypothetical protein B296_00003337 [Ensete ventricosum]